MYARKDTAINYTQLTVYFPILISRGKRLYILHTKSRLNLHRDPEAHEVLPRVILQHPLALDLDGGVGGQDGDLHLVDQLLAHLYTTVASAEMLTCIKRTSVKWQLDTRGYNAHNLQTKYTFKIQRTT